MLQSATTLADRYLHELRALVCDLGRNGGQISPSVYDTAQVLRLYPPSEGVEAGLSWIASQQRVDGGWGNPDLPLARDVPTLAAILALHTYRKDPAAQEMIEAGLAFLRSQAAQWSDVHLDLLPVAVEIILPYLINEANAVGLHLDHSPYRWLYQVRAKKQQVLNKIKIAPTMPPTYSWEALGCHNPSMLSDGTGGIGHSPAATAAWLQKAHGNPHLAMKRAAAEEYLENASAATGMNIPGIVPTAWPITGFELAYAPYILLLTDLFDHPAVFDVLTPIMSRLEHIMITDNGVNFGHDFTPDIDETSLAFAALYKRNRQVNLEVLNQFRRGNHFCTFEYELNSSVFSNAHAVYALGISKNRAIPVEEFLISRQLANGRWMADKWHTSWLYTTSEVIYALTQCNSNRMVEIRKAGKAILDDQNSDGGWGSGSASTRADTSFALIALRTLQKNDVALDLNVALDRGINWLREKTSSDCRGSELLWLGKEIYTPRRVDRIYELSALLAFETERALA